MFSLGLLTWLIVVSTRSESDLFLFNLIILIIGALGILVEGWTLVWLIQKLRVPAPMLRLNHEGILVHDAFGLTRIRWDEIAAIFPYQPPGAGLVVGIAVKDFDALLTRHIQENASGILMRWALRVNAWLSRHIPGFQAQVHIPQRLLYLPIHELMAEIRTHFATELNEYQIRLEEWAWG